METGFKLETTSFDPMINYQFSQRFELLGDGEFNHVSIILHLGF